MPGYKVGGEVGKYPYFGMGVAIATLFQRGLKGAYNGPF